MIDKKKFSKYVFEKLLPYFKKEAYIKKLSTRKLIKLAHKIIWKELRLNTAQEAIYEEMIKRLEQSADTTEFMHRIKPEIIKKINKKLGL